MEVRTENKLHMPRKRQFLVLIPFALFYCAAAILGQLEKARTLGSLRNLGRFVLWFLGSYGVLLILCMVISQRKVIASGLPFLANISERKNRAGKWYIYVIFTVACLLCYMPYFLMYFPGWLNNDAVWQIEQILGWVPGSNHHPYFHTLIMKCFFMAGYRLFGTYTDAAAFYTFFQMLIMAMVFAFFLYWLYRRGTRLIWLALAFVFYAVVPINGMLTICMGKDEFFTAAMLLFAWMTVEFDLDGDESIEAQTEKDTEMSKDIEAEYTEAGKDIEAEYTEAGKDIEAEYTEAGKNIEAEYTEAGKDIQAEYTDENIGQKRADRHPILRWAAYFVVGLLVCLLRSNGIFIFLGTAFILVITKMRSRKFPVRTFACVIAVLVCYMICHGPVLNALHVEPPDTIEGLTMPTQHILCAYLKGGQLTGEEIEMIDRVAPADQVEEYYNPWLFDPVKNFIRAEGNQQAIEDNKWEYFKLWLRVGLRNPFQYMVAEVRQTAGYWAYDVKDYEYVYGEYYMVDNPFGITAQRKFFTYENELAMHDFLMGFQDWYNKVWSLGLNTWLMVFGIAYMVYNRRNVMIYVPFIVMLATLLLATPVYNEFRYAYGLFAAFPMLFHYSFGAEEDGSTSAQAGEEEKIMSARTVNSSKEDGKCR